MTHNMRYIVSLSLTHTHTHSHTLTHTHAHTHTHTETHFHRVLHARGFDEGDVEWNFKDGVNQ